jgi:hypothetical protein
MATGGCLSVQSDIFWDPPRRDAVSISAGMLDGHTGLRTAAHWYVSQTGEYYDLPDDGLPRHHGSGETELA